MIKNTLRVSAFCIIWLFIMAGYFITTTAIENYNFPIMLSPFKDFYAVRWDEGYLYIEGTLASDSNDVKDQLPLQTNVITCRKPAESKGECTITTSTISGKTLAVSEDLQDIKEWNHRYIYLDDSSSICYNDFYTIDRVSESFTVVSKKKENSGTIALCKNDPEVRSSTLKKGFDVYWQRRKEFEERNSIYFHGFLFLLNLLFGLFVLRRYKKA